MYLVIYDSLSERYLLYCISLLLSKNCVLHECRRKCNYVIFFMFSLCLTGNTGILDKSNQWFGATLASSGPDGRILVRNHTIICFR